MNNTTIPMSEGLQPPKAILVAVDLGIYDMEIALAELAELSKTAGITVVGTLTQKRTAMEKATLIGSGRLEELGEQCKTLEADMVIFDHELSPSQLRNIEKATDVEVIDRTTLILNIFAQRAGSHEGRLQVELAQQRYRLPRLAGQGRSLSRLGAGSALSNRGPGETKLESDRRHVRRRITALEEQLKELEGRRGLQRKRRKKDEVVTVAIVGYTNVGKSSLLGRLASEDIVGEDKLFATLDPTMRMVTLPDKREVMLVDTVGFIRRLPHHLVEAFKSTLEEAANADLILNVCDAASGEAREQLAVTTEILGELGAGEIPAITVFNKCDKLVEIPDTIGENTVFTSVKTGFGLDRLLELIGKNLTATRRNLRLLVPFEEGGLIAEIRKNGDVLAEEFTEHGTLVHAWVDEKIAHKVEKFIVKE